MWKLKELNNPADNCPQAFINRAWQSVRPENYKKHMLTWKERIRRAWLVFVGKADCFMWPEDEQDGTGRYPYT